jgi:hypothetical protein
MSSQSKALDALNLRRTYADICRGYSTDTWRGAPIYIKHLAHYDQVDIDLFYEEAFTAARARGIKTRAERMAWLQDKKLWTQRDEVDLKMQQDYAANLTKTRSKQFLQVQIAELTRQLNEANDKLWADMARREKLIGLTAEQRAEERIQSHYLYVSCFRDRALSDPFLTAVQVNQLDEDESDTLISLYVKVIGRLDMQSIRRIALAPCFTNHFYLCAEQPYHFFAKPMAELSNYQINLLSYGAYYRNLLSANEVPNDIREDPDKVEEFITKNKNFKDAIAKSGATDGSRVGIVGASQADFEALGLQNDTKTMNEHASKQYANGIEAAKGMGVTWL